MMNTVISANSLQFGSNKSHNRQERPAGFLKVSDYPTPAVVMYDEYAEKQRRSNAWKWTAGIAVVGSALLTRAYVKGGKIIQKLDELFADAVKTASHTENTRRLRHNLGLEDEPYLFKKIARGIGGFFSNNDKRAEYLLKNAMDGVELDKLA